MGVRSKAYHDPENAIRSRDERVTRPSILRGKQFGGDGVQNPVHDVARETISAIPPKERIGRPGRRGDEDEYTSKS